MTATSDGQDSSSIHRACRRAASHGSRRGCGLSIDKPDRSIAPGVCLKRKAGAGRRTRPSVRPSRAPACNGKETGGRGSGLMGGCNGRGSRRGQTRSPHLSGRSVRTRAERSGAERMLLNVTPGRCVTFPKCLSFIPGNSDSFF